MRHPLCLLDACAGSTAINSISIAWSLFSLPGTAIAFLVMQRHGEGYNSII